MRSVLENIQNRRLEQRRQSRRNLPTSTFHGPIQVQNLICNSCYQAFKKAAPEERLRPPAPEEVIEDEEPQAGPSHAIRQGQQLEQEEQSAEIHEPSAEADASVEIVEEEEPSSSESSDEETSDEEFGESDTDSAISSSYGPSISASDDLSSIDDFVTENDLDTER